MISIFVIFIILSLSYLNKQDKNKHFFFEKSGIVSTIKKIKTWIDNEVLPALVKYGTYSIQPDKIKIFYDDTYLSDFYKKQ